MMLGICPEKLIDKLRPASACQSKLSHGLQVHVELFGQMLIGLGPPTQPMPPPSDSAFRHRSDVRPASKQIRFRTAYQRRMGIEHHAQQRCSTSRCSADENWRTRRRIQRFVPIPRGWFQLFCKPVCTHTQHYRTYNQRYAEITAASCELVMGIESICASNPPIIPRDDRVKQHNQVLSDPP